MKRGYVLRKKVIYIFYSYVFGLYFVSLAAITANHNHGCNQKYIFCLFITFIAIYIKYVHYGSKSKAIISHDWYYIIGSYFTTSCMWRFPTYFKDGSMLESVVINSRQDSLD